MQVCLIEVHVDALELQVRVAVVRTRRVDAVLVRDHLPELGADLVACVQHNATSAPCVELWIGPQLSLSGKLQNCADVEMGDEKIWVGALKENH